MVRNPVLRAAEPGDYLLGVLVRREHGVEYLRDDAVVDDQRHTFEQRHAGGRERRQPDRTRQFETLVGQDREWQMQPLDRFTLVGGVLGGETVKAGDSEP